MVQEYGVNVQANHALLHGTIMSHRHTYIMQAANLAGFRASEDPRFEAGIPDFL